ncbi:MAG: 30S ribosomal protein S6e [Methanomicrobiales archaeon]|nr:30S ribosomal protein S6e [Methanomicrobiales archaeon]
MVEFKVVVSEPANGRAYTLPVSGGQANTLIGKKIGDEVDGAPLGLPGYRLKITGGSDRDGTPARADLPGLGRLKVLLSESTGFHPRQEGQRRRKSIRRSEIAPEYVQINTKVISRSEKSLDELLAKEKPAEKAG